MARFAVSHRHLVTGIAIVLIVLCGGFAALTLKTDTGTGPRVTLDRTTAALQAELDSKFPNIEQTFLAVVESREAGNAKAQALALASSLQQRPDLFSQSFVPGTGPFYAMNALLFSSPEEVEARVDRVLQMQPLYQALATAPDIMGLSALVAEIGRVVEQGRSPPGLETVLLAAATAIESDVRGNPRPIDWTALSGLRGETQSLRWFVVAMPKPGLETEAAAFARRSSDGMQGVNWLWPRRALASSASPLRDFIVPGGLSFFILSALLAAGLGSFRLTAAIMICGAMTVASAAAAAGAAGRALDSTTWSFAAAALAPVIAMGTSLALAYQDGRRRGLSAMQSAMLAAQHRGGLVSATAFVFVAFWASWLVRQLPSLSHYSMFALIGTGFAWLSVMILLPAAAALLERAEPRTDPHWLDDALGEINSGRRNHAADILAMLVLAAAIFSAVFLPGVRFGERVTPSVPAAMLDTPDARGAIHLLVRPEQAEATIELVAGLPEVGAIRAISQFMPPEIPAKLAELRRLSGFAASDPQPRGPPDETVLRESLVALQQQLTAIAAGPATSEALRDASLRLRRAVSYFADSATLDASRLERVERALFSGLGELSRMSTFLAASAAPRYDDMSPDLLRRFVAADGTWRIEVMAKPGTGTLSFAAAMRRAVPTAAGEPLAALVRNEIIHHETLLALAMAAVAASVLVLAALRNPQMSVVAILPVAAIVTLTAAASAFLEITLNSAMLAGASVVAAVLLSSTMAAVQPFDPPAGGSATNGGMALRAALVPPVSLAGAVAPFAISSLPVFADLGVFLAVMLLMAAMLCFLLVPALSRWLNSWAGLARRP